MGDLAKDTKNLILGNDGSEKEPVDFKTELQDAIKKGLITKADGTLLITSRTNCDKLGELITKTEEKDVIKASREEGIEFETLEEAKEYAENMEEKKEDKEKKEREKQLKTQEKSLEQQIQESQNRTKARMEAEKELQETKQNDRK